MNNENYLKKDLSYFINPRLDLISLMPINSDQKILEVGMGGGDTLVHIKKSGLASEVVGIDLMQLQDTHQQNTLIDKALFFDLDKVELPFDKNYFDVIIAGDVLEHLIDPWHVLQKLAIVLRPGGCILISLPNIRDIKALYSIVFKGTFQYNTQGIFDKTHMRFFCKKDMIALIESIEGLKIEKVFPVQELDNSNPRRKLFNTLSFGFLEGFTTTQFVFKVIKSP